MLSLVRGLIHLGCLLPLLWLGYNVKYGDISQLLGADPIKELIHFLGLTALYIFSALFILRMISQLSANSRLRSLHQDLGLWGLFWLILHLGAYLIFELALDYRLFLNEVITRPYLLLGSFAFLIFLVIAVSSAPVLRRKMAKKWFILHQFSHLAIVLAIIHYYWSSKGLALQPRLFLGFAVLILLWKGLPGRLACIKRHSKQKCG
ncbi:ferric reductase-like transmembrane domain-containing protein [Testudinibacter sp. P27/CKL/0425]